VEPGETEIQAVEREVREEVGLKVRARSRLGQRVHPDTGRLLAYWICEPVSGDGSITDTEELPERSCGLASATLVARCPNHGWPSRHRPGAATRTADPAHRGPRSPAWWKSTTVTNAGSPGSSVGTVDLAGLVG
jgi:ADP-ribose pyrophosphatase YjhB (NUDIX family)